MLRNEALLDTRFDERKSYVFGRARNSPLCSSFAESDSFLLCDRGENGNDGILEDPARIEVCLGETAITDAGPSQSVEMSEGFKDAFAGEADRETKTRAGQNGDVRHLGTFPGTQCGHG